MSQPLTRHPLSAEYEDITGVAFEEMVEFTKEFGVLDRKVVLYEGQVLDGWQLYRVCIAAGIEPPVEHYSLSAPPRRFVDCKNSMRRMESPAVQTARRMNRRKLAAEMRANGESLSTIATATKVSKAQAAKDAEAGQKLIDAKPSANGHATTPTTPEPEKTTGRDGKKYNRKKPKKPAAAKSVIHDDFGNILPQRCRDAFKDPFIQTAYDLLCEIYDKLRQARLADGMNARKKAYPHIDANGFIAAIGMLDNNLDKVIQHVKEKRPAGVCLECEDGKGCAACCMSGMVPREVYKAQEQKARKR